MLPPPKLKAKFDICSQSLSVLHGLSWSHVGLVIKFHKKVRDELLYLARQSFLSNYVCGKSLIHQVHSRSDEEVRQGGRGLETRGDVLIRGLWES